MLKEEFIDRLRRQLAGKIDDVKLNETLNYYSDYILIQVRNGKTEETVLDELGDPKLLARSIVDSQNFGAKEEVDQASSDEYGSYKSQGNANMDEQLKKMQKRLNFFQKVLSLPKWMLILLVILVVSLLIVVVFGILSFLAPVLLPVLLILTVVFIIRISMRHS